MSIAENIARIRYEIAEAARSVGRDPSQILLCAATKMNDADAVRQAIAAGVDCCGENRVQELTQKLAQNAYKGAQLHFIGHLQTNKVRQVVGKVDLIQSADRFPLLKALQAEAAKQGICQDILLQVNVGREESKGGFLPEQMSEVIDRMPEFPNLRVRGIMAIPPICKNPTENNKFFQEMYNLSVDITRKKSDNVFVDFLSMGMSDDYSEAIRCGSNMVRIGTGIFGQRNYAIHHQR